LLKLVKKEVALAVPAMLISNSEIRATTTERESMTKIQEIEKLNIQIADVEDKLAVLQMQREHAVRELLAEVMGDAKPARKPRAPKTVSAGEPSQPKAERKLRADGLPAKILALLTGNDGKSFEADEIASALRIEDERFAQVRTTLSRMLKNGQIASAEKGKYQHKPTA
jgi:hypothetical protein